MNRSVLLTIDGIINLTLGVLLIILPGPLVEYLGIPVVPHFFPNILGGVLIGIGIALFLERGIRGRSGSGLGLDVAIAINLFAGLVLAGWLVLGDLALPLPGQLFLWTLVILRNRPAHSITYVSNHPPPRDYDIRYYRITNHILYNRW